MHKKGTISHSLIAVKDGVHPFSITVDAAEIDGLREEFTGPVKIEGHLRRLDRRIHIEGTIVATAQLVCDRSLEMYTEVIEAVISLEYRLDSELAARQFGTMVDTEEVHGLRDDQTYIDFTDEVRQELTLVLPMKRVAPQYRDLEIKDLHPDLGAPEDVPNDDMWSALRKLKQ